MITHLACIMDGNRRFARKSGHVPWHGHKEGAKAAQRVIDFCLENAIPYLSLYVFSTENFKRHATELEFLWNLVINHAQETIEDLKNKGVRVRFIGDRSLFPPITLPAIEQLENATAHSTTLTLNLLFCYGAQQEIIAGTKAIVAQIIAGIISQDDISPELFAQHLWTQGVPPPDLILRTGGRHRLSNFLLYQAAYSELYFLDCLWPEISSEHLQEAIASMYSAERNFGA